jgi:hypothetical protein
LSALPSLTTLYSATTFGPPPRRLRSSRSFPPPLRCRLSTRFSSALQPYQVSCVLSYISLLSTDLPIHLQRIRPLPRPLHTPKRPSSPEALYATQGWQPRLANPSHPSYSGSRRGRPIICTEISLQVPPPLRPAPPPSAIVAGLKAREVPTTISDDSPNLYIGAHKLQGLSRAGRPAGRQPEDAGWEMRGAV